MIHRSEMWAILPSAFAEIQAARPKAAPYNPKPYHRDADELVQCPQCGRFNDSDAHYCDQCGFDLVAAGFNPAPYQEEPDETVQCPQCGRMNDDDAHYCDQCGYQLEGSESVNAATLRPAAARGQATRQSGAVAVLPLMGSISQRGDLFSFLFGGTSTESFGASLAQAVADPNVAAIVLNVDSPGGTVAGVPELAAQINAARGTKPIVAVANGMAASAAYWLASQCDELVVTPSGEVGSIGVFCAHFDESGMLAQMGVKPTLVSAGKFKTEANPFEPLGADALGAIQQRVNDLYGMFVSDVAKGRGATTTAVEVGFGQGRMLGAKQAVSAGMADRVATLDATISRLSSPQGRAKIGQRAEDVSEAAAPAVEHETQAAALALGASSARLRRARAQHRV